MLRVRVGSGVVRAFTFVAALLCLIGSARGFQDDAEGDDAEAPAEADTVTQKFLAGLRERGYFDIERGYLEKLRKAQDVDAETKATIDLEVGKSFSDESESSQDFEKRKELVNQARARYEAFVKVNPNHVRVPEALVRTARLEYLRGLGSRIEAEQAEGAERQARLAEARAAFERARNAYSRAEGPLLAAFEKFPAFIDEKEKDKRAAKAKAHDDLMNEKLQRALVDYEEAQSYPVGSKERSEILDRAIASFDDLNKKYRTQMAGLTARAFQAKCFEERGEDGLGPAMGIYNELLEHPDPRLRPLQMQVLYFKIIALRKRKEYALAADEAARWLAAAGQAQKRTALGIGVKLELAKNIISQIPGLTRPADKEAATKKAIEQLVEVSKYSSQFKLEAIELLKKYRPKSTAAALSFAKVNYEDAVLQADDATATEDWPRAVQYLRVASAKLDPAKDLDKLNTVRYRLAYSFVRDKRFVEGYVAADFLARRYPRHALGPQAAGLGMSAALSAYLAEGMRRSDLQNLIDLAGYAVEAFPDTEQADIGRIYQGEIALGQGRFADAAKAFELVRPASTRRPDALMKSGVAHWNLSTDKLDDAEAKLALERLNQAYGLRKDAGALPADPGMINNACEIADIQLQRGKWDEAAKILEPHDAAAAAAPKSPDFAPYVFKLISYVMRCHIAGGQSDRALADMKRLEAIGGSPAELTALYLQLGKLLKKQMADMAARRDRVGLSRTQETYQRVLKALVDGKAGQTWQSMQWAGEQLLDLGAYADAAATLQKTLSTYSSDAEFQKQPNARRYLLQTQLKLISAFRGQGEFDKALALTQTVIKDNPSVIEPQFELGLLYEAKAFSTRGSEDLNAAFNYWSRFASRLEKRRNKPTEFFEAYYHAALVRERQNKPDEALKVLRGVVRLNPKVGTPEIKAKYDALIKKLQGAGAQARAG